MPPIENWRKAEKRLLKDQKGKIPVWKKKMKTESDGERLMKMVEAPHTSSEVEQILEAFHVPYIPYGKDIFDFPSYNIPDNIQAANIPYNIIAAQELHKTKENKKYNNITDREYEILSADPDLLKYYNHNGYQWFRNDKSTRTIRYQIIANAEIIE